MTENEIADAAVDGLCLACQNHPAKQGNSRQLCFSCASKSEVRALFPRRVPRCSCGRELLNENTRAAGECAACRRIDKDSATYARIGAAEAIAVRLAAGQSALPTRSEPGSIDKLAVLMARAATGAPLWRRGDKRVDD